MADQRHTPGPWAIETPCGFPYTGTYIVTATSNAKIPVQSFIAEIRQYREREESDANAELIASAPTLQARIESLEDENKKLKAELRDALDLQRFSPEGGNDVTER